MVLGERFYQMSNAIFYYDLTPTEFMVYNYLVCVAGQKGVCWPSVHKIAVNCNCPENTVRKQSPHSPRSGSSARQRPTRTGRVDGAGRRTTPTTSSISHRCKAPPRPPLQKGTGRSKAPQPHNLRRESVCGGVCGSWAPHGTLTRQTNPAPRGPFFDVFPTPEG